MSKKAECRNSERGHTMLLVETPDGGYYACANGCGKRLEAGPPFDIGQAHVLADIKGYGLRSHRR